MFLQEVDFNNLLFFVYVAAAELDLMSLPVFHAKLGMGG